MPQFFPVKSLIALAFLGCVYAPAIQAQTKEIQKQKHDDVIMLEKMALFGEVFTLIKDEYVEEVDQSAIMTGAINNALSSLDPHSRYVPLEQFQERQKSARHEYGGLGIEVALENGLVKVKYVIPGGPADKAGLKAGDFVTAVEGRDVRGKTLNDAVDGMLGKVGEAMQLTVLSTDNIARDITVVRENVQGRAVRHRVEDEFGYLYLETFSHPRLAHDVEMALKDLKQQFGDNMPGLIIDVRGNPGGLVDQVVAVAGNFLNGGEVFSARGRNYSDTQRYNAEEGEMFPGVPIVVLINSRSASASEILAGSLQDRDRAIIVGRRSFGKGSVQSLLATNNGGALRLTTQRYYTPSGRSIQANGIIPDLLVALESNEDAARKRFREKNLQNALANLDSEEVQEDFSIMEFPPEDWPEDKDYQLERAKDVLRDPSYVQLLANRRLLQ